MPTIQLTSMKLDARWREMLLFVLIVPPVLVVSDMLLLNLCAFTWHFLPWIVTYVWYTLQTAAVGYWVGIRLSRSPWWWGILAWTILLVNGQVFSIVVPEGGWYDPATSLGFAYASAQIGLAVVWSILGAGNWRIRVPLFLGGCSWALLLGAILGDEGLMVLLMGQTLAAAVCCLAMRAARFRFHQDVDPQPGPTGPLDTTRQFSIRHVLFWTTIVAILAAVLRVLDWSLVFGRFRWSDLIMAFWFILALTMVTMIATWITLGRERWAIRIIFGFLTLPVVGCVIAYMSGLDNKKSWLFRFIPPWTTTEEWMVMWSLWTALAGLFLAGLLVVFRASGLRLMRVEK